MLDTMKQELKIKNKITAIFFLAAFLSIGAITYNIFGEAGSERWNTNNHKNVTVIDGDLEFYFTNVTGKTVGDFLATHRLSLQTNESVFPSEETEIFSDARIYITRARKIIVNVDGGKQIFYTQAKEIEQALRENNITLNEDDIVKPSRDALAENDTQITITRVTIEEQVIEKPIAFDKKVNEDDKLSWRKNIVTQKGEKGVERFTYRVSLHNGKEVNRKLLKKETTREPVTEITTQGTYVKLGKIHRGAASWYAWSGTMAAANPWLPMGSYVKVTNLENGKSVIVKINDRGPFAPGRIIDLDKTAFAKIASLGSGVINVKMEEIAN
jgi:uncharacterized protein YabE (DUF348 family)